MKKLVLTCEHGGNSIPDQYQRLFENHTDLLYTHRGYDPGALNLARHLEQKLKAPLYFSEISRLVIELNRSLHHPDLFSSITKELPDHEKKFLINEYYSPYRNIVEENISKVIQQQQLVLHISVHSFTPVLHNVERNCEIGLLFDPKRKSEKDFCKSWKFNLLKEEPLYRIRYNYPYKGIADGFTTYLRKKFPVNYLGIELELNQKILIENQEEVNQLIAKSLSEMVGI
ncbi:N-formylglutamate amidohydrolase [soil metagenome]